MTRIQTRSRFAKFFGALACAAALAPGLAGAQDFRHVNQRDDDDRFDGRSDRFDDRFDNDRFDNDRFSDEDEATPTYAGDALRFRGPRYEDPEVTALRAQLERIESRIEQREAYNEQLSDTLADANRDLRIATAQHRSARARFINSLGSRRQASAFQTFLFSSQRLMSASATRAQTVSRYNDSMEELATLEANRDRAQAALDAKIEECRFETLGGRGHGRNPVIVTPPSPPSVVVRTRHAGPGIVVTPVGYYPGN